MKQIIVILLLLATSAFCWPRNQSDKRPEEIGYHFAGYSQTPTANAIDLNFSLGFSHMPFKSYDMEIGIDVFHIQATITDDFQLLSDEAIWSALSLTPFAVSFTAAFVGGPVSLGYIGEVGVFAMMYLWHGSIYLPIIPGGWIGIVNKHRFLTQIITEGWHKGSFTFQDDLGLRFYIDRPKYVHPKTKNITYQRFFIDTGCRFEKNFAKDTNYKLFLQVGHSSL